MLPFYSEHLSPLSPLQPLISLFLSFCQFHNIYQWNQTVWSFWNLASFCFQNMLWEWLESHGGYVIIFLFLKIYVWNCTISLKQLNSCVYGETWCPNLGGESLFKLHHLQPVPNPENASISLSLSVSPSLSNVAFNGDDEDNYWYVIWYITSLFHQPFAQFYL